MCFPIAKVLELAAELKLADNHEGIRTIFDQMSMEKARGFMQKNQGFIKRVTMTANMVCVLPAGWIVAERTSNEVSYGIKKVLAPTQDRSIDPTVNP